MQGEPLSLTVTLPNEQRIETSEAVMRWVRGDEHAGETVKVEPAHPGSAIALPQTTGTGEPVDLIT